MKKGILFLCILFLITALTPISVKAANDEGKTVIWGLAPWNNWLALPSLLVWQLGEDHNSLPLPEKAECFSSSGTIQVPVTWKTDEIGSSPGWYEVTGVLLPPDDAVVSENMEPFFIHVLATEPDMEPICPDGFGDLIDSGGIHHDGTSTVIAALPAGTSSEAALEALPFCVTCLTPAGEFSYPVHWDLSSLQLDTPGKYELRGTPDLPFYFSLPIGFEGFQAELHIQADSQLPDLSAVFQTYSGWKCVWAHPLSYSKDLILEYAVGEAAEEADALIWTADPFTDSGDFPLQTEKLGVILQDTSLTVLANSLSMGLNYQFRLRAGDLVSNSLSVKLPSEDAPLIVEVFPPDQYELRFFEVDQPLRESQLNLPETVDCLTNLNHRPYVSLPVSWNMDEVDPSLRTAQTLRGTIRPEAGFEWAEGVSSEVTCVLSPMWPDMEAPSLDILNIPGASELSILPAGGDPGTLPLLSDHWVGVTGDFYFYCTADWDLSALRANEPGRYSVTAQPALPYAYTMPPDTDLTAVIAVLPEDRIDLSAYKSNVFSIQCEWLYSVEQPENMTLERAVGAEPWQTVNAAPDPYGEFRFDENSYYNASGLFLSRNDLEKDVDYYYRFQYDGRISNVLHVRNEIDSSVIEALLDWGDRGGADSGEQQLPDLIQRPPKSPGKEEIPVLNPQPLLEQEAELVPPSNDPAADQPVTSENGVSNGGGKQPAAAPQERVAEDTTVISNARLHRLLADHQDTLLFEKHGISVELPAQLIRDLDLSDDELLEVVIKPWTSDGFSLAITAGGVPLSTLPPTVVRFPFSPNPGADTQDLFLFDEGDNQVCKALYDEKTGIVTVRITAAGRYRIAAGVSDTDALSAAESEDAMQPTQLPSDSEESLNPTHVIFAASFVLFLLLVMAWRIYKKGGGRHD